MATEVLGDAATLRGWYVDEGLPLSEIGARIGVTTQTVGDALRRHGIPVRPPGARRDPSSLLIPANLSRLRAEGRRTREIAAAAGVTDRAVRRALRAAGLPPQDPRRRFPELLDREWLAARNGVPAVDVASELGCSPGYVKRRRAQYGLPKPRARHLVLYPRLHDRSWLREQLLAGRTDQEIASRVGCSLAGVKDAVRKRGLAGLRAGIATSPRGEVRRAWTTGEPVAAIAKRLGTSTDEVWRIARHLKLDARAPARFDEFVAAVVDGEAVSTAAARAGISHRTALRLFSVRTGRTVRAARAEVREQQIEQLAAAFDAGATLDQLCLMIDRSPYTVSALLRSTGRQPSRASVHPGVGRADPIATAV